VRPDEATEASVSLERLPPPTGGLAVTANINSAVVEVDGEPAGFTPLSLNGIGLGEHGVRVVAPGMRAWQGDVEVFAIRGHPKAKRAYAWAHESGKGKRLVAVLELPPVSSPETAVRASIIAESKRDGK